MVRALLVRSFRRYAVARWSPSGSREMRSAFRARAAGWGTVRPTASITSRVNRSGWTLGKRLGRVGAMVVDGVEVGGDESSPTEAVVGGALLALRGDLNEFKGWQVGPT